MAALRVHTSTDLERINQSPFSPQRSQKNLHGQIHKMTVRDSTSDRLRLKKRRLASKEPDSVHQSRISPTDFLMQSLNDCRWKKPGSGLKRFANTQGKLVGVNHAINTSGTNPRRVRRWHRKDHV